LPTLQSIVVKASSLLQVWMHTDEVHIRAHNASDLKITTVNPTNVIV